MYDSQQETQHQSSVQAMNKKDQANVGSLGRRQGVLASPGRTVPDAGRTLPAAPRSSTGDRSSHPDDSIRQGSKIAIEKGVRAALTDAVQPPHVREPWNDGVGKKQYSRTRRSLRATVACALHTYLIRLVMDLNDKGTLSTPRAKSTTPRLRDAPRPRPRPATQADEPRTTLTSL